MANKEQELLEHIAVLHDFIGKAVATLVRLDHHVFASPEDGFQKLTDQELKEMPLTIGELAWRWRTFSAGDRAKL